MEHGRGPVRSSPPVGHAESTFLLSSSLFIFESSVMAQPCDPKSRERGLP